LRILVFCGSRQVNAFPKKRGTTVERFYRLFEHELQVARNTDSVRA